MNMNTSPVDRDRADVELRHGSEAGHMLLLSLSHKHRNVAPCSSLKERKMNVHKHRVQRKGVRRECEASSVLGSNAVWVLHEFRAGSDTEENVR